MQPLRAWVQGLALWCMACASMMSASFFLFFFLANSVTYRQRPWGGRCQSGSCMCVPGELGFSKNAPTDWWDVYGRGPTLMMMMCIFTLLARDVSLFTAGPWPPTIWARGPVIKHSFVIRICLHISVQAGSSRGGWRVCMQLDPGFQAV